MTAFLITYLVLAGLALLLNALAIMVNPAAAGRAALILLAIIPMAVWAIWLLAKNTS